MFFVDFTRIRSLFRSVVVAAVIDGFSRKVLALRACRTEPDAAFACRLVREAIRRHGKPKWLVSDRGVQFASRRFSSYLVRRGIRRRFGAIGSSGSVARIERFWRTLKTEAADMLFPWRPLQSIESKLSRFAFWFNSARPHGGVALRAPDDLWFGRREAARLRITRAVLVVRLSSGDPNLPYFRLRAAS